MNIDFPHLVITVVLMFTIVYGLSRVKIVKEASKGKRFLMLAVPLFVVLFIFNLIWQ